MNGIEITLREWVVTCCIDPLLLLHLLLFHLLKVRTILKVSDLPLLGELRLR